MKNMKKIFALVVALMVIVASFGALADTVNQTNLTVTVTSQFQSRTYKAYQIFAGDINTNTDGDNAGNGNNRKLSNITWATGVNAATIITELNKIAAVTTANGGDIASDATGEAVAEVLSKITAASDKILVAKALAAGKPTTAAGTSSGTGTAVSPATDPATYTHEISGLSAGYYIILDETTLGTDDAASAIMLNVVGNTQVTEKVSKPSIDKEVTDEVADKDTNSRDTTDGYGETADHEINESFQFKVTATLPSDPDYAAYDHYKVMFTDTPSTGITFESINSVVIAGKDSSDSVVSVTVPAKKADGTDLEKNGYVFTNGLTDNKGDGTATLVIDIADLKLTAPAIDLTKGATVTLIYTAHLNESAYVTPVGGTTTTNKNKVKLTYSNNPNTNGTGDTTEKETYVFTYTVLNTKWAGPGKKLTDEEAAAIEAVAANADPATDAVSLKDYTGTSLVKGNKYYVKKSGSWYELDPLAGAGFTLYKGSKADANKVKLIDNQDGTYTYADQSATSGYVTEMTTATTTGIFDIKGLDADTYILSETTTPSGYNTVADQTITITASHSVVNGTPTVTLTCDKQDNEIVDESGSTLPSTGGIGTTLFYVGGGILVLAAIILLVTKRRMGNEE